MATLRGLRDPAAERMVGLTEADCYAPGLNFIFGQAVMGGREAVVAVPRLRQSFYGWPEEPALFRARVLKEVVHELGHTWGLAHCSNRRCVMHFSNTVHDTDSKDACFCPRCREKRGWQGPAARQGR
jgi:archaemetzincin